MVLVGPQGAARFDYHGAFRLKSGANSRVFLALVDLVPAALDISNYVTFVGGARREQNEALTTAVLFPIVAEFTTVADNPASAADGTDGLLTLIIDGTLVGQNCPIRGYFDIYAAPSVGGPDILVTGRFECVGSTVDSVP